ncbi:DNA-binding MarR family transcriptional regulator [Prauserella sediminis]|uniref:DNA-binding MarR family transcriptional regulator n=1 Tax=Prauserella sediminis TaxID=577680 RepID=A0A839XZS1_9PSEU|nr:MarR family transcriptional regulator [Prauserella sediminis]MBB3665215.1 DNA-binding MarR family transcriptional regulator [Prauserella sediminis]
MTKTDPAMLVGELIRLATPVGHRLARDLALSLNDLTALHHLVGRPPLGPADLGKRLGMSSASATVLVDRLEQAGYARRERDPHDRRRVVVTVTAATEQRSLAAVAPLVEAITKISTELDATTRQAVTHYLSQVVQAMQAFVDHEHAHPAAEEAGTTTAIEHH